MGTPSLRPGVVYVSKDLSISYPPSSMEDSQKWGQHPQVLAWLPEGAQTAFSPVAEFIKTSSLASREPQETSTVLTHLRGEQCEGRGVLEVWGERPRAGVPRTVYHGQPCENVNRDPAAPMPS